MEEEMRKIEEEFAFQEKWIEIFKRGKFFFQNIPELLILKIITKMKEKVFFKLLRTGKWMHLLCRENRNSLLIPFEISNYNGKYVRKRSEFSKKERNRDTQKLRKIIRSKYYFFLCDAWCGNLEEDDLYSVENYGNLYFLEDFYSKEVYHFHRECWNTGVLHINKFPTNISLINHLQPIVIKIYNQNGPLSENFNISARTKKFRVEYDSYDSISDSDFYKEIERFGSLPLKTTFRRKGYLEFNKLFSTLKGITQERHLHHPLQFLTYKRESRTNYAIFDSWPMDYSLPTYPFYFIIVAKSDVGVNVIHLFARNGRIFGERHTLQIMGIKSFDEWEEFAKRKIVDGYFSLEAGQTYEKSNKQLAEILEVFNTQIASKFFEGAKLAYPPFAPEPAPEFVEFLKEFEDFDIQPEKLAPHKPKWKKTEKLPDLPRKLPEIHSNNWLIEAKEVIKLRKFWMDFLQKGKFILELMPLTNVLDIAKKIERRRFPLLFSSTKWVNELIQNSASNFRIHGGSFHFSRNRIYRNSSVFKEALKSLEFYYLYEISFDYFNNGFDINDLKEVLQRVRERKIFVRKISLGNKCPLIQELFESFARGPKLLRVTQYTAFHAPVKFSPQLKEIEVDAKCFKADRIKRIKELVEGFTGIEQEVTWFCSDDEDTNEIITHHLETLKSKKCPSNIQIINWNVFDTYIYDSQFDLSQISETVFIFRSMARGRGGVWNYFIRLEKAGSGAVGITHFVDSLDIIEEIGMDIYIRCKYFPTMESFLDYFEREVGSERRSRDWMQLRKKDETIEPREEDFNDYKIRKPYIHFNEQKEADDLEEVQRRFFS